MKHSFGFLTFTLKRRDVRTAYERRDTGAAISCTRADDGGALMSAAETSAPGLIRRR